MLNEIEKAYKKSDVYLEVLSYLKRIKFIYLEALFFSSRAPDYSKYSLCLSYLEAVFFYDSL